MMVVVPPPSSPDPFDLGRFVTAQEQTYDAALRELEAGRKTGHWMWFVFPQAEGLGRTTTSRHYAIRSLDEARAYLDHPVLGHRLVTCCEALLRIRDRSARAVMGDPDDLKLRSSMTLFATVAPEIGVFSRVLERFFEGEADPLTVEIVRAWRERP